MRAELPSLFTAVSEWAHGPWFTWLQSPHRVNLTKMKDAAWKRVTGGERCEYQHDYNDCRRWDRVRQRWGKSGEGSRPNPVAEAPHLSILECLPTLPRCTYMRACCNQWYFKISPQPYDCNINNLHDALTTHENVDGEAGCLVTLRDRSHR